MLAIERLKKMQELLNENGSIIISNLSESMDVSEETIRRDLEKLGKKINIKRVHGGAFLLESDSEVPIKIREKIYLEEKQMIGAKCESLIRDGESIMLDSSTTAWYVAKNIKSSKKKVTIITNSNTIVNEFSENKLVNVICLGGVFRKRTNSFIGHMTTENLSKFSADKAFISCTAITKGIGATDNNEGEAKVRQLMLEKSIHKYLIMDYTKFDSTAVNLVCPVEYLDAIITDCKITDEYAQWFKSNKVEVFYCK